MKCKNCGEDLVLKEGRAKGHCVECGASFTVDPETKKQSLDLSDEDALDRLTAAIAERLLEKQKGSRRATKKADRKRKRKVPENADPEDEDEDEDDDDGDGERSKWD